MKLKLRYILIVLLVLLVLVMSLFIVRFILGGNEDTWICEQGHWIKHGSPSQPVPQVLCR